MPHIIIQLSPEMMQMTTTHLFTSTVPDVIGAYLIEATLHLNHSQGKD